MKVRGLLPLAGLAVFAAHGFAQVNSFTLVSGGWTYSENNLSGPGDREDGGLADFVDPGGTDHMFQNWWWYSTPNTGRELALGQLVNVSVGTNSARVTYREDNGPNGPGALTFDLEYTLHALPGGDTAVLQIGWKIHNNSSQVVPLRFFSYTDYDLAGDSGGDTGEYFPDGQFALEDGNVSAGLLGSGTQMSGWEQDFFANLRGKLTDNDFDTLANGTSPLGPGDITNAFSWETELFANGDPSGRDQMVGSLIKFVDVEVVPEPASMAVLGLGMVGLLRRRRK